MVRFKPGKPNDPSANGPIAETVARIAEFGIE
jgi:hypothetical protein